METPFYSQNTGRFYPFDEARITSVRDECGECVLDVLYRGIVDLGIAVISSDDLLDPVISECEISKVGNVRSVSVTVTCSSESHELTFSYDGSQDFVTVKSSNGRVYGFLTFGVFSAWSVPDFSVSSIPVYRGCVKWLNHVQLDSVSVVNGDRWLPKDECNPDRFADRPQQWSYGYVTNSNMILKAGYNCKISFLERENKIQIQPMLRAGMGEVKEQVGLGYDLPGSGSVPDFEPYFNDKIKRFDTIQPDVRFVRSVAGAYGVGVSVTHDYNFRSQVIKDEEYAEENNSCVKQHLCIKCVYKSAGDCYPEFAPDVPADCEPIDQ